MGAELIKIVIFRDHSSSSGKKGFGVWEKRQDGIRDDAMKGKKGGVGTFSWSSCPFPLPALTNQFTSQLWVPLIEP